MEFNHVSNIDPDLSCVLRRPPRRTAEIPCREL